MTSMTWRYTSWVPTESGEDRRTEEKELGEVMDREATTVWHV